MREQSGIERAADSLDVRMRFEGHLELRAGFEPRLQFLQRQAAQHRYAQARHGLRIRAHVKIAAIGTPCRIDFFDRHAQCIEAAVIERLAQGLLLDVRRANEAAAFRHRYQFKFAQAGQRFADSNFSQSLTPRPAHKPVAKQALSRYPPVGASQSSISPATNTLGIALSMRC